MQTVHIKLNFEKNRKSRKVPSWGHGRLGELNLSLLAFKRDNAVAIAIHNAKPKLSCCQSALVLFRQNKPDKLAVRHYFTRACHCARHDSVDCFDGNTTRI